MVKSSIHIKKGNHLYLLHNSRENFSYSVVFNDESNEVWNNSKEAFTIYQQELQKRAEAYTRRTNKKLHSKTATLLTAVVNLEKHHTLKDLDEIVKYIEDTLDTIVIQKAIHRDEGKLVSKKNGTILTSGEDFFKNPKNGKLYYDKQFTKEIDLSQYKIEKNYHAHIEFLGLDSKGQSIKRNRLNKYYLSNLQTFVANSLGMERGVNYTKEKKKAPKRLDVREFKKQNKQKRENQKKLKELLKAEISRIREELKASQQASKADYDTLNKLNRDLKQQIKEKQLNVEDLKKRIQEFQQNNQILRQNNEEKDKKIQDLQTEIKEIQKDKKTLMQMFKDNLKEYEKVNEIAKEALEDAKVDITKEYSPVGIVKFLKKKYFKLKSKVKSLFAENKKLKEENQKLKENQPKPQRKPRSPGMF